MNNKDINKMDNLLKKGIEEYKPSVLDILNRGHDEDLISKYLKYIFDNEPSIVEQIISKTYNISLTNITIEEISNEYSIDDQKRIDILIRGKHKDNKAFLILIENKTWSKEHSNQTKRYYDWADKHCLEDEKYYLFLVPKKSKQKEAICKEFRTLYYEDLYEILKEYDDKFIRDISNTIKNNLIGGKMNELDKLILSNYYELNNKIKDVNRKISNYFEKEYVEIIKEKFSVKYYHAGRSYTFFKDNWWNENLSDKKKQFYFYYELDFIDHDFNKITFKATVKRYEKDSFIDKKIREKGIKCTSWPKHNADRDRWFVFKEKHFDNKGLVPLSDEWKNELEEQSIDCFNIFVPELENIVKTITSE